MQLAPKMPRVDWATQQWLWCWCKHEKFAILQTDGHGPDTVDLSEMVGKVQMEAVVSYVGDISSVIERSMTIGIKNQKVYKETGTMAT